MAGDGDASARPLGGVVHHVAEHLERVALVHAPGERRGALELEGEVLLRVHLGERIADPVEQRGKRELRREGRRAARGGTAELVLDDVVHARHLGRHGRG
jgi:hypothetical protein